MADVSIAVAHLFWEIYWERDKKERLSAGIAYGLCGPSDESELTPSKVRW